MVVWNAALNPGNSQGVFCMMCQIEENLAAEWGIVDGIGTLDKSEGEIVQFIAPDVPGLTQIKAVVRQGEIICEAECILTTVESLINRPDEMALSKKGLPEYT